MGLRQMLPASSRSFWQMYTDVDILRSDIFSLHQKVDDLMPLLSSVDQVAARLDRISGELARLEGTRLEEIESRLDVLSGDLESHDTHAKMMLWEAMRKEGEDIDAVKKRFFRSLPPATGTLRMVQLALTQLLHEFDELCCENGIDYWISCGTVLGAVRHGGFIPWDDDVDLCMMREDIARLETLVENSDRFRVTVVFDYYVKCRQVRFRYCDENMPVFLDLFIFDYVIDADHTVFDRMQQDRRRFIESLDSDPELEFWEQEDRCYTGQDEEGGSLLAAHFNAAVEQEGDASGIIAPSRDQAKGVMWAIDNLDSFDGLDWISSLDDVWPLQRVDFEGIRVNAMAHLDEYVAMHYGDYYTLPKMLASERNHLGQALEDPAVAQALGEAASSMEDVT